MNISISKAGLFKACRRAYYFKYVEGLVSRETSDALETGRKYHERIDALYKGEEIPEDFSKDSAMAMAYKKYLFPVVKPLQTEVKMEMQLNDKHTLFGIADGLTETEIVEHKTTSGDIGEAYEYGLLWNEQILAYMLITGKRRVLYTVCRKPLIRQKKGESEQEFYQRMLDWYDEDTESKIRVIELERTDEEVENFKTDLCALCDEMETTKTLYRNTGWCNVWGRRCEYSSICLNYDHNNEYVEFERRQE